jgi:sec-independent protein translocase protein TatA
MLSIPHMIVVFLVVLVVFGPQKLPELARSFGKLMAEFRKASGDFKSAFEEEMRDLERQARVAELKKQAAEANAAAAAATASIAGAGGVGAAGEAPAVTLGSPEGAEGVANPYPEERVTEAPVITPNADAVARIDAAALESAQAVAGEISTEAKQSELKFSDEQLSEVKLHEEKLSGKSAADSNPSHDQQQPA